MQPIGNTLAGKLYPVRLYSAGYQRLREDAGKLKPSEMPTWIAISRFEEWNRAGVFIATTDRQWFVDRYGDEVK